MSRSLFGWSLPAGCGRLPDEEPYDDMPRCRHCGAFLPYAPTGQRVEHYPVEDFGPRLPVCRGDLIKVRRCEAPFARPGDPLWWDWLVWWSDLVTYWTCRRCGKETSQV